MAKKITPGRKKLDSMGYQVNSLPRGTTQEQFFKTLVRAIQFKTTLPPGWDVTWRWKNANRPNKEDDFGNAVLDSGVGFHSVMLSRLRRDAANRGIETPDIREATEEEVEEIEEAIEEKRERQPGGRKAAKTKKAKFDRQHPRDKKGRFIKRRKKR